ncbi:DUF1850 domain-containing protein [uncultured Ferrovibrio sp.]|uniref:DUF1850 domain-containing protein n=1 Tax=uncultured Ferrovibrio sp. TaxID=1576913 RepID=UPI0026021A9D|nr:DUF1850 domain-containing protein [uncultured Ferrovibrio sp.]
MAGLCLAAGAVIIALGVNSAELQWTHSVQKTQWREHWRATESGLVLEEAAVQSSGAGMEPGEGAVLRDGFWVWKPKLPPQRTLTLTRSTYTGEDWRICIATGDCRPVGSYFQNLPSDQTVMLKPCN